MITQTQKLLCALFVLTLVMFLFLIIIGGQTWIGL